MNRITGFILAAAGSASMAAMPLQAEVTTEQVVTGAQQGRSTMVTYAPGDYTRLFLVDKAGTVRILNLKTGLINGAHFLAITGIVRDTSNEQGLLGLAFHPDYQNNGYLYVNYTNNSSDTVIARYTVNNANDVDETSALTIMTIDQPFTNHNGGWLDFGPDGYLYIGTGDGGSACDPQNNSQRITNELLGKMLRIDVNGTSAPGGNYDIPADNPFVGVTGDDEIWAYGLRNPWRCSFDRDTGDLYIADVGQGFREEVSVQSASSAGGENYGWDCAEGFGCASSSGCGAGSCSCSSTLLTDPVHDYSHGGGRCSITGGYVYRGCRIASEEGKYFFSDYCSNTIWSFVLDGKGGVEGLTDRTSDLDPASGSISNVTGFGEDAWGELYIVEDAGEVWRMIDTKNPIRWADVNCDGSVNTADLLILLAEWGSNPGSRADINGDDEVNTTDLLSMLGDWG